MVDPSKLLSSIPDGLRGPLLASYQEIATNFLEHRWEPAELNGGKFSEVVYTIISGTINGKFALKPAKPKNMVDSCRSLELLAADSRRAGDRSLRILIPRVLQALYEIRNNRGVGHVGGDVDPNFLDATAVYAMSSWVLAEIIRIFHTVSTKDAQETVDALIERKHPLIWEFEGVRRVLDPKMEKGDQVLLLLHAKPSWVAENELVSWVEYKNLTLFRSRILSPFHSSRLIEYDIKLRRVRISPLGIEVAEQRILKTRPQ